MPHASKTSPESQHRPAAERRGASPGNQAVSSSPRIAAQRQQRDAIADSPRVAAQRRQADRMGLPDGLKSGIESLSGLSMDHVRVHYNSSQPAQLNALAYAQGSDIHLAPGQESHLPHEAWHVVQQARGQVRPTMQLKGGVPINDDRGLEREADIMGARASAVPPSAEPRQLKRAALHDGPVQRVKGGIEYTENGPTTLRWHPAVNAPGALAPRGAHVIGATNVEFYNVPDAQMMAPPPDTRHELIANNRVKLTNDDFQSEWIIEGHAVAQTAVLLKQQVMNDVAAMFVLRQALRDRVAQYVAAGQTVVLAPAGTGNVQVPGANGLFVYNPAPAAAGRVQITSQFANRDTIRRINELNAAKYLTGTKVPAGRDTPRAAGNRSFREALADLKGTTSTATAAALHTYLIGRSTPIIGQHLGRVELTAEQVALIKLMVINDAMATNMSHYAALEGAGQEKNIQRFFPKAERQTYVSALTRANVPAPVMAALRGAIQGSQAEMAQAVWDRADPLALSIGDSIRVRTKTDVTAAIDPAVIGVATAALVPAVAGADVTAALTAIRALVAENMSRGRPNLLLEGDAVQQIAISVPAIANPDAVTIAHHVVTLAAAARDAVSALVLGLNDAGRKDFILGPNGGRLAGWIGHAALAYTSAGGGADHTHAGGTIGNVVSSRNYTPLAAGDRGAIYEFREREVDVADGNIRALEDALTNLFGAAD